MVSGIEGIQLRGSVYDRGGIHSFWLNPKQKNLIAVLFELPGRSVEVGDRWEISVNLISMDQKFVCDSAYRKNEVSLIGFDVMGTDTIAIIKYDIVEFVSGKLYLPFPLGGSDNGKSTDIMFKFTHKAIGEFSGSEGKWKIYSGIMSIEATGLMLANLTTRLILMPYD